MNRYAPLLCMVLPSLALADFQSGLVQLTNQVSPPNSRSCMVSRTRATIDSVNALVVDSAAGAQAYLIRGDLAPGGGCSASKLAALCTPLVSNSPLSWTPICGDPPLTLGGDDGRSLRAYHPGPAGQETRDGQRLLEIASGLQSGDYQVTSYGSIIAYTTAPDSEGQAQVRLVLPSTSTTITADVDVLRGTHVPQAVSRLTAKGLRLESLKELGTDGRVLVEQLGRLLYLGASGDCDGACSEAYMMDEAQFRAELQRRLALVDIETSNDSAIAYRLLRRALLIPNKSHPKLLEMGFRQPPGLYLLELR